MRGIKILCTALAVICVICANLPARGGVQGGFNLSEFYSVKPTGMNEKWMASFQVGVFFDLLKIASYVEVRPEVMYIQKGSKMSYMEGADQVNLKVKIDYIEVPVLLKINILPQRTLNPYVIAGPYWAYRSRAKSENDIGGILTKVDIKDETKESDFGLIGGLGLEFKLGKIPKNISLEARYEIGLVDIFPGTEKAKNNSFVFNAGICF